MKGMLENFMLGKHLSRSILRIASFLLLLCMILMYTGSYADGYFSGSIIVSLGDSYSAGEGIPPFYGHELSETEKESKLDWISHRSEQAWPGLLALKSVSGSMARNRDTNWFFAAVSGAKIEDLTGSQRIKVRRITRQDIWLPPQLDIFDSLGSQKADYVTITIGGNDMGFADLLGKAIRIFPEKDVYQMVQDKWIEFYEGGIRDNLKKAYQTIASVAGQQALIIVVGYPPLLSEKGSDLYTKEMSQYLNKQVSKFNEAIRDVVDECYEKETMNICFVSVEETFRGHEAFTEENEKNKPYLNQIMPIQLDDVSMYSVPLFDEFGFPVSLVSAFSIHPNLLGALKYAQCVQEVIDLNEDTYPWEGFAPGPVENPSNGHMYMFACVDGDEPWEKAKKYCERLHGHLVSISSQEENDFIVESFLKDGSVTSAYIGLSDALIEGIWKWSNDEPLIFENWAHGVPAIESGHVDYARFDLSEDGKWVADDPTENPEDGLIGFICEWDR